MTCEQLASGAVRVALRGEFDRAHASVDRVDVVAILGALGLAIEVDGLEQLVRIFAGSGIECRPA